MRLFDLKALGEVVFESVCRTGADVAVVVPLYNYKSYITECLQSLANQSMESFSVVVVDDCSTDGGPQRAIEFLKMNSQRFSAVRLVRHRRNQGLSMARNSGIVWSSEPFIFVLDSDNRLRPPALSRLRAALEVDNAEFSYSQLFIFGDEIAVGMADIWHLDRLRHGNTIDAMALIRRSALISAGGYSVLADDHGWEDFDLWCRFATLGFRGVFVPELLCEYRKHGSSMLNTRTNRNHRELMAEMTLRYPSIFCPTSEP